MEINNNLVNNIFLFSVKTSQIIILLLVIITIITHFIKFEDKYIVDLLTNTFIYISYFLKLYVSLIIIYKFNGFKSYKTFILSDIDRKIIFNSGVFLLLTTLVIDPVLLINKL